MLFMLIVMEVNLNTQFRWYLLNLIFSTYLNIDEQYYIFIFFRL